MKRAKLFQTIAIGLSCFLACGGALTVLESEKPQAAYAAADSTIEYVRLSQLQSFKTKTKYGNWSWSKAADTDTSWNVAAGNEITFTYTHTDYIFYIATGIPDLYDNEDFEFWMTVGNSTDHIAHQGLYNQIAFSDLSRAVPRTDKVVIHCKNTASTTKRFTFDTRYDSATEWEDVLFFVYNGNASFSVDNQGGTGLTSIPLRRHSANPSPIPVPTKAGYTFKGYYSKANGKGDCYYEASGVANSSRYNFTGDVGTVINLYAYWEGAKSTVTLNKNGGTGGSSSVTATYGAAMPSMTKPSKTGYTFQGYYDTDAATGGTQYYNASGASAKNWDKTTGGTLYARWAAKTSTVTFNKDGGSGGDSSVTATYDQAMPTVSVPSKNHHEFLGYFDYSGTKYYNADGTSAKTWNKEDSSVTLYAHWLQLGTTITFNKQGGSGGTSQIVAPFYEAMPSASMPSRSGYIFNGYFDQLNGQGTKFYNADGSSANTWDSEAATATLYASWTIKSEVQNAINKIDEIGLVKYPDSQDAIEAARAAYDAVGSTDQGGVENYYTLVTAENRFLELKDAKEAADPVNELIDAIGEVAYPDSHDDIEAARNAFDALTTDDERDFSHLDTLEAAEEEYATLRGEAIDNVEDLINEIGEVTYPGSHDDIEAARNAYDALHANDKASVSNYDTLTAAEARFLELKDAKEAADPVNDLIDAIGTVTYPGSKGAIEAAREAFDALANDDQRSFAHLETLEAAEEAYAALAADAVDNVEDLIDAIGTVTYPGSGNAIEAARSAYNALLEEDKPSVDNYATLTAAEATYKDLKDDFEASPVKALIAAIGEVKYPESNDAIKAAREVYEALTNDAKAHVDNLGVLTAAEETFKTLRAAAIDNVEDLIDAIGEVAYPDNRDEIEAARDAYDALLEEDRVEVSNYQTLVAAEARFDDLKEAGANAVEELIEDIGELEYSDECKGRIDAARNAYEPLTDEQKELVENYDKLTHAETVYTHVHEVAQKIDNIGDVDLNSGERISTAEEAYEALTDEEKALITSRHDTLLEKGQAFDKMVHDHQVAVTWAIMCSIVGGLIVLLGACYLLMMFVFNKWIKEDDKAIRAFKFGRKEGKVRLLVMPLRFEYREEDEVFDNKEDALN